MKPALRYLKFFAKSAGYHRLNKALGDAKGELKELVDEFEGTDADPYRSELAEVVEVLEAEVKALVEVPVFIESEEV